MRSVVRYFVEHRTAPRILLVAVLLAAVLVGPRIRSQVFPDVPDHSIGVEYRWAGVGAADIDAAIAARAEARLRALDGVESTRTASFDGYTSITVNLAAAADRNAVRHQAEAELRRIRDMPADATGPTIRLGEWKERVGSVVLSGAAGLTTLIRHAEALRKRLAERGIVQTTLLGVPDSEIVIEVRRDGLHRFGLVIEDIAEAVKRATGVKAGGETGADGSRVRLATTRLAAPELAAIVVRSDPSGVRLTVGDVAVVGASQADRGELLYRNGHPAVVMEIERGARGDAIAIQRSVAEELAALRLQVAGNVSIEYAHSLADPIIGLMQVLAGNAAGSLAIVILVLMIFLNWRFASMVGLGIVTAIAATTVLMFAFGQTFNLISLFALILCLGIVVDDGIVVAEHTDLLHRRGLSPRDAATLAATRMAGPVFAAAVTTVIAFGSLALIDSRFGRLISDLPLVVGIILVASLLETWLLLPSHLAGALAQRERWQRRFGHTTPAVESHARAVEQVGAAGRIVHRLVRGVVAVRYPVLGAAVLVLAHATATIIDGSVPWRFFSAPGHPAYRVNIAMQVGARRSETKAMMTEMERALGAVAQRYQALHGKPPVRMAVTKIGGQFGYGLDSVDTRTIDQLAGIEIELLPEEERPYPVRRFVEDWKREVVPHPALDSISWHRAHRGPRADAIDVKLSGPDAQQLRRAAEDLVANLGRRPVARDVTSDLAYGRRDLVVRLTPRGEAAGFTAEAIAAQLRARLEGIDAARAIDKGQEMLVIVKEAEDAGLETAINDAMLRAPGGGVFRLDDAAEVTSQPGLAVIRRNNGLLRVTVQGDVGEDDPAAAAAFMRSLSTQIVPAIAKTYDVDWTLGGLAQEEKAFVSKAVLVFAAALLAIYLILAWTSANWSLPLVIMLAIPFSLIGSVLGHWLHEIPMGMLSVVGYVGLSGIVINNAIMMVERFAAGQAGAIDLRIADTVQERMRPMLLTTATTIAGLMPLLLERSRHVEILKPAVVTLTYGLATGLVFVLLCVPAMLAVRHDLKLLLGRDRNRPAPSDSTEKPEVAAIRSLAHALQKDPRKH